MKALGILSLLFSTSLIVWFFSSSGGVDQDSNEERVSNYENTLDSAREAVDLIEGTPSVSSRAVFVYDGISVPDDVRILDLSGKNLSGSLNAEIRELTNLRLLDISNNNFTGLPAEVGQLSQLEELNLSHNPLTGLPLELGNLSNLNVLDLQGTDYSEYDLGIIRENLPADTVILTDSSNVLEG